MAKQKKGTSLAELSAYVLALAGGLGGKGRQYKSCVFGAKGVPKPGNIARCNRLFFGSSKVSMAAARGMKKGRGPAPGAKASRTLSGQGGAKRRAVTAGPGQRAKAGRKQAARRRTEGR